MTDGGFRVSYRILNLGALNGRDARDLPLMDITNYSLKGDLEIVAPGGTITLVEVPLLEAFYAIRQILKIVPIFTHSTPYAQMFREARTCFTVEGDSIVIQHHEIELLRLRSGSERISGSFVDFCTAFGSAAKSFVSDLAKMTPSLFADEKSQAQFADLFVGVKIKENNPAVYSIV